MNNTLPVTMADRLNDLNKDLASRVLIELDFFFQELQQFSSCQIFHHDNKLHIGECVAVENFDDVGV